jgi:hypothetical protein
LSEGQLRRWRNPRKKAIVNLVELIGDKPISEITRATCWTSGSGGSSGLPPRS